MKKCVPFPCNLFLKCASPTRMSRWDPGQRILHSVPTATAQSFQTYLAARFTAVLPPQEIWGLTSCVPCFFFAESQQIVSSDPRAERASLLCSFFLLVFAWPLCVCGLGQGNLFLLCLTLRAPGHRGGKGNLIF